MVRIKDDTSPSRITLCLNNLPNKTNTDIFGTYNESSIVKQDIYYATLITDIYESLCEDGLVPKLSNKSQEIQNSIFNYINFAHNVVKTNTFPYSDDELNKLEQDLQKTFVNTPWYKIIKHVTERSQLSQFISDDFKFFSVNLLLPYLSENTDSADTIRKIINKLFEIGDFKKHIEVLDEIRRLKFIQGYRIPLTILESPYSKICTYALQDCKGTPIYKELYRISYTKNPPVNLSAPTPVTEPKVDQETVKNEPAIQPVQIPTAPIKLSTQSAPKQAVFTTLRILTYLFAGACLTDYILHLCK